MVSLLGFFVGVEVERVFLTGSLYRFFELELLSHGDEGRDFLSESDGVDGSIS